MSNDLSPRMTRLDLLRRGAALGTAATLPSLLAACGGSGSGSAASGTGKVGGNISMLSWEGYDVPALSKAWARQHGVTFKSTYVGSNDEIGAKAVAAKNTGTEIDYITYNHGYRQLNGDLGLLQPIDVKRIPNYQELFPYFRAKGSYWVDPDGTVRGVPLTYGFNGITYDSSVLAKAPDSWDAIFEPKWKGKVAVVASTVDLYEIAAHVLGFDPTKLTDPQFTKVEAWLAALVKQTRGISPTNGDAVSRLVSGDSVFVVPGWAALDQFAADAGKKTIKTILPREGTNAFCDAIAIPPTAKNVDSVYAWINYLCAPKNAAKAATALVGGTPVASAAPLIPKTIAEPYHYPHVDSLFEKAILYTNPPLKSTEYKTLDDFLKSWNKISANA